MNSNEYWEQREKEALKHYITEEAEFDKEIERIYRDMLDGVQKEIDSFYGKYAAKEGITIAEAKKRVSKADIAEYERKAERYVKAAEKDRQRYGKTNPKGFYFSEQADAEMRLYNAMMKINRLEMLKANIGIELIKGHSELEHFMDEILKGRTEAELARQAGILGNTVIGNAKAVRTIVNASFKNATFSQRVWGNQALMKADLDKLLQTALIQGKNPRVLAKELEKYFIGDKTLKNGKKGAKYAAESLMRTELARVQTEAQKESFIRNGFEEYTFHALGTACGVCAALNGKHFKVKDMMPGENASPLHPSCRCSVSAYEDSDEYEAWLDYLNKGGTTAEWNRTGKAAWKEAMSKGAAGAMMSSETEKNSKENLEFSENNGKIVSGARIIDPESEKGKAFAESFYPEIRKRTTDTKAIAQNIGKTESDIKRIKNYLFMDDSLYDDDMGIWRKFDADCAIAQSWQRLTDGKDIKKHDITLIEHELYEMKIKSENQNISHEEAHAMAQKKYNYRKEMEEYYGNLNKSRK